MALKPGPGTYHAGHPLDLGECLQHSPPPTPEDQDPLTQQNLHLVDPLHRPHRRQSPDPMLDLVLAAPQEVVGVRGVEEERVEGGVDPEDSPTAAGVRLEVVARQDAGHRCLAGREVGCPEAGAGALQREAGDQEVGHGEAAVGGPRAGDRECRPHQRVVGLHL